MPLFAFSQRCVIVASLAAVGAAGAAAIATASPDESPVVLDLPGGGMLPGVIVPIAPASDGMHTTLRWQSPLLSRPLRSRLRRRFGFCCAAATCSMAISSRSMPTES
jgi:hypothetical protein